MRVTALRNIVGIAIAALVLGSAVSATADTGTCKRKRQPPNQNLFWLCVTEGVDCGAGRSCQTVSYGGFVPYSTCECLPTTPDPNDFSYGTGGIWNTAVTSGVPGPGASVEFQLVSGLNELVIYANAEIDAGQIQNPQLFTGSSDLSGSFTVQMGAGPVDSIEAHITALSLTMTSFSFEGEATGTNSISLALDGSSATGHYIPATHTLQFDEPVHCLVTNALAGSANFYFRPILTEGQETAKSGLRIATNPFELFATGRYEPSPTVPVLQREWGNMKTLFR